MECQHYSSPFRHVRPEMQHVLRYESEASTKINRPGATDIECSWQRATSAVFPFRGLVAASIM